MLQAASGAAVALLTISCMQNPPQKDGSAKSATTAATSTAEPVRSVSFDELVYPPPAGYTLKDDTSEDIESPIPGGAPAQERFRSYVDAAGNGLYMFCFRGFSGRDRGPMKADESWTLQVGGREAVLSKASMFFGTEQNLLTAHFEGPSEATYVVYTNRLDRSAFEAFLSTIRFR